MTSVVQKVIAVSLAGLVLVVLAVTWLPRLLSAASGPEGELITLVKHVERDGLSVSIRGRPLEGKKVLYQRLTVTVDAVARRATVIATLDFTGTYGHAQVSSLGVEKIVFVSDGLGWKPQTNYAPRLIAAVGALEARRQALEAGDRAALERLAATDAGMGEEAEEWLALLERTLQVSGWFIRLEREGADVSEEYRLDGVGRDRPLRKSGTRRLTLQRVGGEFFFPNGLM